MLLAFEYSFLLYIFITFECLNNNNTFGAYLYNTQTHIFTTLKTEQYHLNTTTRRAIIAFDSMNASHILNVLWYADLFLFSWLESARKWIFLVFLLAISRICLVDQKVRESKRKFWFLLVVCICLASWKVSEYNIIYIYIYMYIYRIEVGEN